MSGEDARRSFLLAAARGALGSSEAPDLATALDAADWELLLNLADAHRVTPLLCAAAAAVPDAGIPDAARGSLDRQRLALAATHLGAVSDLRRALGSLSERGLAAALAAAPDAVLAVSGVAGWGLIKVTLLVAPRDGETARAMLMADGWRESAPATGAGGRIELVGPAGTRFVVEREVAELERSCTVVLAGQPVAALAPEERLIALCARATAKQWARLDYLVAVAALSREIADPGDLLQRARRVGLDGAVLTGVALAHDTLGVETALTPMALRDRPARDRARDAPATGHAPRKLVLRQFQSPGDLVMLTAAVRDLHLQYPGRFVTDVRTPCPDLWLNNPYITPLSEGDAGVEVLPCEYPLIHRSNQTPVHFVYGFIEFLNEHLGLRVRPSAFHGDIHLSDDERREPSLVQRLIGAQVPYWIVSAGGKRDFTIKWWSHARYQEVVDRFRGRLLFVQTGEAGHHHPPLDGVVDLRGKTSLRDLIRLVHHADGVVGPVSLAMHLAAAVETRAGAPGRRPCVVVAGGREPVQWEAYPGHRFLHTIGALPCCETGGCWRSRTLPIGDGDEKDDPDKLCVDVVDGLPRCMDVITAVDVERSIEEYLRGEAAVPLTAAQYDAARAHVTAGGSTAAAANDLPAWCLPCPATDRRAAQVTVVVLAENGHLPPLQACIGSIRSACLGHAGIVVGAIASSSDVREWLHAGRRAGEIDRLHESPVAIDRSVMARRVLSDIGTEYIWMLDAAQVVSEPAFARRLAAIGSQDADGPDNDGLPPLERTAAARERLRGRQPPTPGRERAPREAIAPAPPATAAPDIQAHGQAQPPPARPPLCFTTCFDRGFFEGAKGTIRSIRKFYGAGEAAIVAFAESPLPGLEEFCRAAHAELHYFRDIAAWALPLIYSNREFAADARHFYHPDFQPLPGLPHHTDRAPVGFGTIRHLNPLNVKAYCTGYCLSVKGCEYVVHIDADAFLLSRVDDLLADMPRDSVFGFDDGTDGLPNLEALYGVRKPEGFHDRQYAFNAGVVFYRNGQGVRRLMLDFMHYVESCYHYTYSGSFADQGLLRALVAAHHISGRISFELRDGTNWNPTWNRADNLRFCPDSEEWINLANGKKQFVWHGAGGEKLWSGRYRSESVNAAWKYVGGAVHPWRQNWWDVKGSLIADNCEAVCALIANHHAGRRELALLEIGTQFGRTSIAFCSLLRQAGKQVSVDTCDIFAPSPDYPAGFPTQDEVLRHIREFGLESAIRSHTVGENEDLAARFAGRQFDVVFIDGNHQFKQVLADCFVAKALLKPGGLIVGDDWQLPDVRNASRLVFAPQVPEAFGANLWSVRP